jgi:hypothetical protein
MRPGDIKQVSGWELTVDGKLHPANDKGACPGLTERHHASTSPSVASKQVPGVGGAIKTEGQWQQVLREGNPMIN